MLAAVAIVDSSLGLGYRGGLQFHIREDLKRFAALTKGQSVIYGRKTLLTFPNAAPLPGRRNLILSANPAFSVPGAEVVRSKGEALDKCGGSGFVIGGASVYRLFLDATDTIYLTRVDAEAPHDALFPPFEDAFSLVWEGEKRTDAQSGLAYRFQEYRRTR